MARKSHPRVVCGLVSERVVDTEATPVPASCRSPETLWEVGRPLPTETAYKKTRKCLNLGAMPKEPLRNRCRIMLIPSGEFPSSDHFARCSDFISAYVPIHFPLPASRQDRMEKKNKWSDVDTNMDV